MAAFPGYWAFTGGGVSRVDTAAVESFSVLDVEHGKFIACILRETCEELGVAPNGDHVISIDENARFDVIKDKANWLPHAEDCNIPVNTDNINILGHRITPPFGPVQFDNAFIHFHCGDWQSVPEFDLEPQTEFDDIMWARPQDILKRWSNHEIKVAPPVISVLMEIVRVLEFSIDIVDAVQNISRRQPGRQSILFAYGVEVVPIRTATLPPADHTNCYLVGDPEGDFIIVDPAVRYREDMESLAEAVERHKGQPVAIAFTHSHGDHLADMDLLKEAFDLPVWGSEYTSRSVDCNRILVDGEVLQLGKQAWQILITPGHHPGHTCFLSDAGLVAGDMLAGFGTILIPPGTGDMDEYLQQLARLRDLEPHLAFPSHGPVIALPEKKFNYYINHRSARHDKILQAVIDGLTDVSEIAVKAYEDTPDAHPGLARDQTLAHLLSHQRQGKLSQDSHGNWHASID
jgi:glyoxylase-like metal-dependent hydrolase (beta-lactamase superfamily II)/8-oxo-dGTP pyrophosphatase MutT (NUDIX family)